MTRVIKNRADSRKTWGSEILFSLLELWDRQSYYYNLVVFVAGLSETTVSVVPLSGGSETPHAVVFFGSG